MLLQLDTLSASSSISAVGLVSFQNIPFHRCLFLAISFNHEYLYICRLVHASFINICWIYPYLSFPAFCLPVLSFCDSSCTRGWPKTLFDHCKKSSLLCYIFLNLLFLLFFNPAGSCHFSITPQLKHLYVFSSRLFIVHIYLMAWWRIFICRSSHIFFRARWTYAALNNIVMSPCFWRWPHGNYKTDAACFLQ